MKDILKSLVTGAAVAAALVAGTYGAARLIDGCERWADKRKKEEAKPAAAAETPAS
jgi:hypothetical protein